eukprot:8545680-Ditylum_brightwellii.AAC.2
MYWSQLAGTHAGCNIGVLYGKRHYSPDHHKQFVKDFEVFLEEHLNKNEELILGIYVNEEDSPDAEIQQLACQLDVIDAHQHLHGTKRAPAKYKQGHHQLDFLFIMP